MANIAGLTPREWYKSYVLPVLAQVFLEEHSYTLPEPIAKPANKNRRTGRFTSPYREWYEANCRGNTAPAEAVRFIEIVSLFDAPNSLAAVMEGAFSVFIKYRVDFIRERRLL